MEVDYKMIVKEIIVDEIPASCNECIFARREDGEYICAAIDSDKNFISSYDLYRMTYRRSDCKLVVNDCDLNIVD